MGCVIGAGGLVPEMQALNQKSVMESPTASYGVKLALLDEGNMNIYNVIVGSVGTVRRGDAVMYGFSHRRESSSIAGISTKISPKTAALSIILTRAQMV